MSYRCEVCKNIVPPMKTRLTHAELKKDGNIAREMGVCPGCKDLLLTGLTVYEVAKLRGYEPVYPPPLLPDPATNKPVAIGKPVIKK